MIEETIIVHYFLVVLYKNTLIESPTLDSLKRLAATPSRRYKMMIWDNSPSDFIQVKFDAGMFSTFAEVEYHRDTTNRPLAALYNQVVDRAIREGADLVTLLDQDSEVPSEFSAMVSQFRSDGKLIVPKVRARGSRQVVSPRFQNSHSWRLAPPPPLFVDQNVAPGPLRSTDFFAVGSGLTIPKHIWVGDLKFDENLKFYGVDTEFCRRYSKFHPEFILSEAEILHDISSEGTSEERLPSFHRFQLHMEYWEYQLATYSSVPPVVSRTYVRLVSIAYRTFAKTRAALRSLSGRP